jgi:hypothetical protein
MMGKKSLTRVAATTVALVLFAACAKKQAAQPEATAAPAETPAEAPSGSAASAPKPAAAAAESLPGANSVREALAKKDYDTAVGALLALRGMATGDKMPEYTALYGEVIDTLRSEASSNRKAAEAYGNLLAASRGR